jgi:hypothetical protein
MTASMIKGGNLRVNWLSPADFANFLQVHHEMRDSATHN